MDDFYKKLSATWNTAVFNSIRMTDIGIKKIFKPVAFGFHSSIDFLSQSESSVKAIEDIRRSIRSLNESQKARLEEGLKSTDKDFEKIENSLKEKLRSDGADPETLLLSRENLEVMEKIGNILDMTSQNLKSVSTYQLICYLLLYKTAQDIALNFNKYLVYGDKKALNNSPLINPNCPYNSKQKIPRDAEYFKKLEETLSKVRYYSKMAHGCYGETMNLVYSKKDITKAIRIANYDKEFLKHCGMPPESIIHSNWESSTFRPAYCLVNNAEKKELVICLRGSMSTHDFMTDLVCTYMNISAVQKKDGSSDLVINYTTEFDSDLSKTLSFKNDSPKRSEIDKVMVQGFAHSGIFLGGLELFREIQKRVSDFFERPTSSGYGLTITGHSLGAGSAVILFLLFKLKPLNIRPAYIRAFTFGCPPSLSKEFDVFFRDDCFFNVVYNKDMVTRLSFGWFKDMENMMLFLREMEKKKEEAIFKRIERFDRKKKFEMLTESQKKELVEILGFIRGVREECFTNKKLVQVGRTLLVRRDKQNCRLLKRWQEQENPGLVEELKKKLTGSSEKISKPQSDHEYLVEEIEQKVFTSSLLLSKRVVSHHFPHVYEKGLFGKLKIAERT